MRPLRATIRSLEELAQAAVQLRAFCGGLRLPDSATDEWELCLAEAVTAILTNGDALSYGPVELEARSDGEMIELELRDHGIPLPKRQLDARPRGLDPLLLGDAAQGVGLVRLLTDELHYRPGPPNQLLLRRALPLSDARAALS